MSTELDRQQAAREVYDFYTKAALTGRTIGPGSLMYSFYDDASGRYHFFNPRDQHVLYVKFAHPQHGTHLDRSAYGPPIAITGQDQNIEILTPYVAFGMLRSAVLRPADYSYVAVFDMSRPSWIIPVGEWPSGAQVNVRGDGA